MPTPYIFLGIAMIMVTLFIKVRKSSTSQLEVYRDYLEDEQAANFCRRADPKQEEYLTVDISVLPVREYSDAPEYRRVKTRQENALKYAQMPMTVLTRGMTNREIKQKYGAVNLDTMITFEENYDRCIHALLEWAVALKSLESVDDAATVLEAAIDLDCDRSQAYTLLAEIYACRGERGRLTELRTRVSQSEALDASVKERAVRVITELEQGQPL